MLHTKQKESSELGSKMIFGRLCIYIPEHINIHKDMGERIGFVKGILHNGILACMYVCHIMYVIHSVHSTSLTLTYVIHSISLQFTDTDMDVRVFIDVMHLYHIMYVIHSIHSNSLQFTHTDIYMCMYI